MSTTFHFFLEMSYVNLDLDVLCSRANPSSVHFVTREWEKAESPSIYWYRKFKEYDLSGNLNKISLSLLFVLTTAHCICKQQQQ